MCSPLNWQGVLNTLDLDDGVSFWKRYVDGLPLFQLASVSAMGQVISIGHSCGTEKKVC